MNKRVLVILFFILSAIFSGQTAPAYPDLILVDQPNGEKISVYIKGDEKIRWMESEDGYSLLYNSENFIVYAILDENQNMVPSSIVAQNSMLRSSQTTDFLKNVPKKLFYSESQINAFRSIWEIKEQATLKQKQSPELRSTTGIAYALCALIEFSDLPISKTREEFEALLNQAGYRKDGARGSVSDFYYENSYGQLELIIHVAGPYQVSKNCTYYGENSRDQKDIHAQELAREAARLTFEDPNINPEIYDNDNDGNIDTFHFIYAGYGEESGGGNNTIWAHKSDIIPLLSFSGKKLNTYSCSPELRGNSNSNPTKLITHIGVICHELCHIFGAPDFYDTSSNGNFLGTGQWDLMANGSWNGGTEPGSSPAHINMYQKIQFGWVNPVELNSTAFVAEMKNAAFYPEAYFFHTSTLNEYFVLENRQKTGFDSALPGNGLLIYRVSITFSDIIKNQVNSSHPQKVYPICASSNYSIPTNNTASYGNINSAGCPFPGSFVRTDFTDQTIPSAISWAGNETRKPITDIREKDGMISFSFMKNLSPTNLSASINGDQVTLMWEPPQTNMSFSGYKIYRDNQELIFKSSPGYRERVPQEGTYLYGITAIYTDFESDPIEIEVDVIFSSLDEIRENFDANASVYIYDLHGKLILNTKYSELRSFETNRNSSSDGIYIIRIFDRNRVTNYKWIIK